MATAIFGRFAITRVSRMAESQDDFLQVDPDDQIMQAFHGPARAWRRSKWELGRCNARHQRDFAQVKPVFSGDARQPLGYNDPNGGNRAGMTHRHSRTSERGRQRSARTHREL